MRSIFRDYCSGVCAALFYIRFFGCSCSICYKKQYRQFVVPAERFNLLKVSLVSAWVLPAAMH